MKDSRNQDAILGLAVVHDVTSHRKAADIRRKIGTRSTRLRMSRKHCEAGYNLIHYVVGNLRARVLIQIQPDRIKIALG